MLNFGITLERALQQSDTLGTFPGTRKRNPQIAAIRPVKGFEICQQSRAGKRPDVFIPLAAQDSRKRAPGVIRRTGTHQIHYRRSRTGAANSRTLQSSSNFAAPPGAQAVSEGPGFRLLPDLARRMYQPALGFLLLWQLQQRAQRVSQFGIQSHGRLRSLLQVEIL